MDSSADLNKLRMRLWDRYLSIRSNGETISFDQYWYEFLIRYSGTESSYEGICSEIEKQK